MKLWNNGFVWTINPKIAHEGIYISFMKMKMKLSNYVETFVQTFKQMYNHIRTYI